MQSYPLRAMLCEIQTDLQLSLKQHTKARDSPAQDRPVPHDTVAKVKIIKADLFHQVL